MDQALTYAVGGFLLLLGFIGCVVPVVPGPLLAYCALWTPFLFKGSVPASVLGLGAGVTVVVMVLDYVLPTYFAKRFHCSRSGIVGCLLGTLAGLFFLPYGLVLGPFCGTVFGELTEGRSLSEAAHGGFGALLGFVGTVVLKFAAVGLMGWLFWTNVAAE